MCPPSRWSEGRAGDHTLPWVGTPRMLTKVVRGARPFRTTPGIRRAGPSPRADPAHSPLLLPGAVPAVWGPRGWACGSGGAVLPPRDAPAPSAASSMAECRTCLHPAGYHPPGGQTAFWSTSLSPAHSGKGLAGPSQHRARAGPGSPQDSSPSPRPKSPSVGDSGGPVPSGAAPADCHLPPAPTARYPFPVTCSGFRPQAAGPGEDHGQGGRASRGLH